MSIDKNLRGRMRNSLASLALVVVLAGCGGGGGGGSTGGGGGGGGGGNGLALTGNNAEFAVGVSDSKATMAGSSVAFTVLQKLSPVPSFGGRSTLHSLSSAPTLVPSLNLYQAVVISGKTLTLSYTTDQAGKMPAGKVVATGSQTIGSTYTYPVTFTVAGDITAGSIPMHVALTITLTDSVGANTMKGVLNMTKDNIDLNLDLSLQDNGQVGNSGSMVVKYNYIFGGTPVPTTTTLTNLKGSPLTTITGDAAVSATVFDPSVPTSGTGTGSIDLVHGNMSLKITDGPLAGLLQTFNGGNDTLTLTTSTGLQKVISEVNTFVMGSLKGSTSGGGNYAYHNPVPIPGSGNVYVGQALGNGEMVGYSLDATNHSTPLYWSSPTALPSTLGLPANEVAGAANGIAEYNGQKVIVGSCTDANAETQPCFWIQSAGQSTFSPTKATNLSHGGVFTAISANGNTIVGYMYDSSFTEKPMAYISGTPYALPTDGRQSSLRAIGVDNFNDILGDGSGQQLTPGVWQNVSVDSASNSIKTHFTPLVNQGISNPNLNALHISASGAIVGGTGSEIIVWLRENQFGPMDLALGANAGGEAYGVSADGTKFAGMIYPQGATSGDLAYWSYIGNPPVDVSKQIGSLGVYTGIAGFFLLNDGSFICLAENNTAKKVNFIYIKKT